jgi:hypothetical protein
MSLENKVIRKKKLDKELLLKVCQNDATERILVEFSTKDGRMILQKSFQNNFYGRQEADAFEKSITTIEEFRARLKR